MKKLLLLLPLMASLVLAIPASAVPEVELSYPPTSEDINVKATICHWASGNLSEPSVSLSAVSDPQDTGHGMLTLTAGGSLDSFVAHVGTGGHEFDSIERIYLKKGNVELDLYVAEGGCTPPEEPEVPVCPEGTTAVADSDPLVCEKTVIEEKEIIKEVTVEKVVEVPVTTVVETIRTVEAEGPFTPPVAAPAAAPTGELPHTGGESAPLALIGLGVTAIGTMLRRLFK